MKAIYYLYYELYTKGRLNISIINFTIIPTFKSDESHAIGSHQT